MFDATNGKKVFELLYEKVIEHNDPQLWYEDGVSTEWVLNQDGYCIWECWDYAADNVLTYLVGGNHVSSNDKTDLMAYVIECNPDDVGTVFNDGFGYLLGQMMQNEYEMGE